MTKRQLIDRVMEANETAKPEFLAKFGEVELNEYLNHLQVLQTPRLSGEPDRYDRYFENCPSISVPMTHVPAAPFVDDYDTEMGYCEPARQEPTENQVHEETREVAFANSVERQFADVAEVAEESSDEFTDDFTEEYVEEFDENNAEPVAVGAGVADDASSFADNTEESESWLF